MVCRVQSWIKHRLGSCCFSPTVYHLPTVHFSEDGEEKNVLFMHGTSTEIEQGKQREVARTVHSKKKQRMQEEGGKAFSLKHMDCSFRSSFCFLFGPAPPGAGGTFQTIRSRMGFLLVRDSSKTEGMSPDCFKCSLVLSPHIFHHVCKHCYLVFLVCMCGVQFLFYLSYLFIFLFYKPIQVFNLIILPNFFLNFLSFFLSLSYF